jgi:hypothetical protein
MVYTSQTDLAVELDYFSAANNNLPQGRLSSSRKQPHTETVADPLTILALSNSSVPASSLL